MKQVIVYSSAACPYCIMAKEILTDKGVAIEERRVDAHPEYIEEAVQKSGGRQTVPQILIGDQHIGGFDELKALDDKGALDQMLRD